MKKIIKASRNQRSHVKLTKPIMSNKYMRLNTARELYYNALDGEYSKDYNRGVIDAIETLFDDGWLNEQEFRTDL